MRRFLITADLHQHPSKWDKLVETTAEQRPDFVLIAGDILPKCGGIPAQKLFFPRLRELLGAVRNDIGARILMYLANDDGHFLEPHVDELEAAGLCVNMNQRIYRDGDLVFCGMNKVRDYPFGYKHCCVPDGEWVADPIQFCGEGITFNEQGEEQAIPNLRQYLLAKPSILEHLEELKGQLQPGEMGRSIWLMHQPPATLGMDICGNGQLAGSPAMLEFIRENQPLLGCSGHIHESPHQPGGRWAANVGNTLWIQPGQVDSRLHYVTLEITDEFAITSVRHSVFAGYFSRTSDSASLIDASRPRPPGRGCL